MDANHRKDTYVQQRALLESVAACLGSDGTAFVSFVHRPCADHSVERDLEFFSLATEFSLRANLVLSRKIATQDPYSYGTDEEPPVVHIYTLNRLKEL